tara:strand:+ start:838 stop:1986 length:1149 start_codon:yes stop_codon:yes gene_type:complete
MDKINLGNGIQGSGDSGLVGGGKINANYIALVEAMLGQTIWSNAASENLDLSTLNTTNKTSLKAAINELLERTRLIDDSLTTSAFKTWSVDKIKNYILLNAGGSGGGVSAVTTEEFTIVAPSGNIGGYNDGDVVAVGTAHIDILEKILRDGEPMSFTMPTGSVNSTKAQSYLYEIGEVLTMNIGHSFNQNDAGAFLSVQYRKGGVVIANPVSYNVTIGSATQVVDALINYEAGSGTLVNAVGEVFTNDILAGSIDTSNLNYAGQFPFFYGKSATKPTANQSLIDAGTKAVNGSLIKSANGTLTINFNASGEFVWFAIPNTAPNKSTYYKTALDTGALTNLFDVPVRVGVNSPETTPLWNNEEYDFYIAKGIGNHTINIEIRN